MKINRSIGSILAAAQKKYFAWQMTRLYNNSVEHVKVLFWVPGGMPLMLHVEGAIAAALKIRGYDVRAVICDGSFRACIRREITDGVPVSQWHEVCPRCKAETSSFLNLMGIKYSFIGDFVPEAVQSTLWEKTASIEWGALESLSYGDVNIGKNVRSAIIRYLKGNSLRRHEDIVREYAFSGLVAAAAASSAFQDISPARIFMSHGIYVDWGPALQIAFSCKIPVTAWMASYLPARFYFRHVEDNVRIDFHNLSHSAWADCKNTALSLLQESSLNTFLENRYKKQITFDMRNFKKLKGDIDSLRKSFGLSSEKPVWGIISHVNWDCVSDYSPMAYNNFEGWILDTIQEIIQIKDVQWLIKIHPAEATDNPESGVQKLIQRYFPSLPPHVQLLSYDEDISPLDFYRLVDGGVTVYGTAGLELALLGKPVILAGEAHYGGKGFTYDGLTLSSYKQLLRTAGELNSLHDDQRSLVRKYAYCYFIQRQIPLPVVKDPESTWWSFQFKKRDLLLSGRDPFMGFICERIMDGKDFIMNEDLVELAEKY
jgi:hypothetical protein